MNTPINEDILTRYVAGELTPQEEAAVREALEHDPAAREMARELEATVALLRAALGAEPGLELPEATRDEIHAQAGGAEPPRVLRFPALPRLLGMAASVAIIGAIGAALLIPERAQDGAAMETMQVAQFDASIAAEAAPVTPPAPAAMAGPEPPAANGEGSWRARADTVSSGQAQPEPQAAPPAEARLMPSAAPEAKMKASGAGMAQEEMAAQQGTSAAPPAGDTVQWRDSEGVADYYRPPAPGGAEAYNPITENPFKPVAQEPLSTFSIDLDTGSYANVRRFLNAGRRPPADAVRIEELVNYFDYAYAPPAVDAPDPFAAHVAVAACPWNPGHKLVRVALKGKEFPVGSRVNSNLVFLVDVSGSMDQPDKLPLVQQGLRMLVNQLTEQDRVSIVVYAGSSGAVLPPTNGSNRAEILRAIDNLRAGGSTNGGEGIQLAYRFAREGFIPGGINRVILASDGDFNAGITSQQELIRLIESEAKSRVFLTVLGFGAGNLKDGLMEQLANRGNGMYAYIDSAREAKKVFVDQLQGALVTIAKDVKIQIEFNPARVERYRLIGYENRTLAARDFNDDTKDAGEIGAGHTVTALYELVPVGALAQPGVDPLKYQQQEAPKPEPVADVHSGELMTLKLRYKQPEGDASKLMEYPVMDSDQPFAAADEDFRFAASVAAFGMLLRNSPYAGTATMEAVREWAEGALGRDAQGYRTEFLDLVRKAASLR
jgi:secreted protein with Ig-like and vWFA domain/anti-sigma factor RsiW